MSELVEVNQGEVKVNYPAILNGKTSLKALGFSDKDLEFESGLLRLVFNFEGISNHAYFKMPTIEISYKEEMYETHWQCDFNKETIVDKFDHHGHSTIILLNRNKLTELEQRHENELVVHAEFPQGVHILAGESYVNFFKPTS